MHVVIIFRLKEVAERWNRYGTGAGSSALSQLRGVRAVAAGPAHIACLLEDGTICRAAFSIIPDRLDLSKTDATKNGGNGGGGSGGGGTGGGKQGGSGGGCGSRQQPQTRARIMRRNSIRAAPSSQGKISCDIRIFKIRNKTFFRLLFRLLYFVVVYRSYPFINGMDFTFSTLYMQALQAERQV